MKKKDYYLLIEKCLSGQASASEKKKLDRWLADDPAHKEIFYEIKLIWDLEDFGEEVPADDPDGLARLQARIDRAIAEGQQAKRKRFGHYLKTAIAASALVFIGFLTGMLVSPSTYGPVKVTSGSRHNILLPDGSNVYLNKNSSLVFKSSSGKREAHLKGEAWFEVKEDETNPFYIYMGEASLRVLGTTFNVKAYGERDIIEVVVTAGSVVFSHGLQRVTLLPGEKGVLHRQEEKISKTVNRDPNFDAWKTGELKFRNTRLDVIIKTLEDHYGLSFDVVDDRLGACRFTGTFRDDEPEAVLRVLSYALDLNFQNTGEAYRVSGKGCN